MALLASGHTALETVSQIGITNFVEGGDDLLLVGICHFHFALCSHARIYAARNSEPGFFGEMWLVELAMGVPHGSGASRQSVVGISEPMRCGFSIRNPVQRSPSSRSRRATPLM